MTDETEGTEETEKTEAASLAEAEELLVAEEEDLGIEWVGKNKALNRAARRAKVRELKRLTRRPEALLRLDHPLTGVRTPYGVKLIAKRRAKAKAARRAKKGSAK